MLFRAALLMLLGCVPAAQAQRSAPSDSSMVIGQGSVPHAFLDRGNVWSFGAIAFTRVLDYHSTQDMRRRGRDEILLTNAIVDNKPLFVAIEVGGAIASIGLSHVFHSSGHHRLERWTSFVHIGTTTFGAVRNYLLDSARSGEPGAGSGDQLPHMNGER